MNELKIAKVIQEQRKQRNMTQEELATVLGVSSQAVSNWERGGYPDITMLPVIANYFDITVDKLIGNDKSGQEKDMDNFYKTCYTLEDTEERFKFIFDYSLKYPKDYNIAAMLAETIVAMGKKEREEHLPLLYRTCEKIINESTHQVIRHEAIRFMCSTCHEEDLAKWLGLCVRDYSFTQGEILENRLWEQEKRKESRLRFDINNLNILTHFLFRASRNLAKPQRAAERYKYCLRMIEYIAAGDEIPKGWLGAYAEFHYRVACALFGYGKKDEGYAFLEKSFKLMEKWQAIPNGTALDMGSEWMFGGVKIIKNEFMIILPDGTKEIINEGWAFCDKKTNLYEVMTAKQGWEWFDSVRNEDLFKQYVEKAKVMAER